MQYGAIHIKCVFLKGCIEGPEANAYAQFTLGKILLEVPNEIRERRGRVQDPLKFVTQSNHKFCGSGLSVITVEPDHQAAELLLQDATLGARQVAGTHHIRNDSDIALRCPSHLPPQ